MKPIYPSMDVVPLSELRANLAELLKQTQVSGRPIVVTQHGRGSAVLISADDYSELLDQIELLNSLVRSLSRSAAGQKGIPHEKVMKDARALIEEVKRGQKTPKRTTGERKKAKIA
jgi:antitoxin YefM